MPSRSEAFGNEEMYHLYNKTIDSRDIFNNEDLCNLFINLIAYYVSSKAVVSFSRIKELGPQTQKRLYNEVQINKHFLLDIFSFCIMPTHFHFLIRQKQDMGVVKFISNLINSFTRYFNLKIDRKGPIFLPIFKSSKISTYEQFIHVSRYIHLNPFSSGVVKTTKALIEYPWSSLPDYLRMRRYQFLNTAYLFRNFKSKKTYKSFILDHADYQKNLEFIKLREKSKKPLHNKSNPRG